MSFPKGAARIVCLLPAVLMTGCATPGLLPQFNTPSVVAPVTVGQRDLMYMPIPPQPIPVAVYAFTDQTGQLKASDTGINYSRAITQGGTSVLISALNSAGNGNWFTVIERERLDNLLRERQIIREMRRQYLNEAETPAQVLPSLLFAGVTLEGGIISFDSAVKSGGIGARFLGIGASTQYRTSTATVYLRAVSVKTGEVLANVVTQKSISSYATSAGVFKYVKFDGLLEAEVGVAANEPSQIAVQAAIEKAVYALILEGAKPGPKQLWSFADAKAGQAWLDRYADDRRKSLAQVYEDNGGLPVSRSAK
ncbi:CsgG/HfaB family protein [Sphingomonas sp.]|jgi:curli production assembly/transport component CsgG|uniref:CsgG/HfaB family protein n=1 Tax=Sphingomonas sp. TaxID=28214 RepID=UPI002D8073F8|nr:CsgG/HfaB family protein [Sphingomonas sp.]HEU0044537.1 CsgG/HfaB family protein [Sphingomonas sp.]